jgi:hypothetical protein
MAENRTDNNTQDRGRTTSTEQQRQDEARIQAHIQQERAKSYQRNDNPQRGDNEPVQRDHGENDQRNQEELRLRQMREQWEKRRQQELEEQERRRQELSRINAISDPDEKMAEWRRYQEAERAREREREPEPDW